MQNKTKFAICLVCLLLISHISSIAILSANSEPAPLVSREQDIKLYLPIGYEAFTTMIDSINLQMAGHGLSNIKIETTDYWHAFQQGLRAGRFGVYFAPPHFAAWAISRHGFKPLVRIPEPLSYVIAARSADRNLFEIGDLAGRKVCTSKPLNLDYLLIVNTFDVSIASAKIEIVDSVAAEMRNPMTRCEAFSLSNHLFDQFEIETPDRFIRLQQSSRYNNYALLVHPDVAENQAKALQQYFLQEQTQLLLAPMLKFFAKNAQLVRGSIDDYPPDYWQALTPYWMSASERDSSALESQE